MTESSLSAQGSETISGQFVDACAGPAEGKLNLALEASAQPLPGDKTPTNAAHADSLHTDPNYVSVSVYVKSKASDSEIQDTLYRIADGQQKDYSQDNQGFIDKFGADAKALAKLGQFAQANGLKVTEEDPASGLVILSGQAKDFGTAFGLYMSGYKDLDGSDILRYRGPIPVPAALTGSIVGAFGLTPTIDGQPRETKMTASKQDKAKDDQPIQTYLPNEVAKLYDFPMQHGGAGQGVAIIEVGGGIDLKDNETYYKEHGLPMPKINIIEIDGAKNKSSQSDDEVNLDSKVVGTVAPQAIQNMIFVPNTKQGFIDAITRSTFQPQGETGNASVSLSWGMPEPEWDPVASHAMRLAIEKAALRGINVYVAAGDSGAQDGSSDNKDQTQFPASVPEAIAVGGTTLVSQNGKITSETTWNNGSQTDFFGNQSLTATGGGVSALFERPFYQKAVNVPAGLNGFVGRGMPDLAGDADGRTGYKIRVDGKDTVGNGTSAATPLYAAFNALINTENGGQSWGWLLPKLYQFGKSQPQVFRDITEGNNGDFKAGPGWDPVSGWGSIRGTAFLTALKQDSVKHPKDN